MTGSDLRIARLTSSRTQNDAAERLGVTQAYLSMVETGARVVSVRLASKAVEVFDLPATALPLARYRPHVHTSGWFKEQLGALGYPGFAYLRLAARSNPARLLMDALDERNLDSRVVEALPWIFLSHPQMDWDWLMFNAKVRDRQNRLGFVAELARQAARRQSRFDLAEQLAHSLKVLESSRLAAEDTLCEESMTRTEREWVRSHRSPAAEHWNLLSDLTVDQLDYAFL